MPICTILLSPPIPLVHAQSPSALPVDALA